jgi:hypothetical protein
MPWQPTLKEPTVSVDFHADMQDALVRMVVPMRRKFGCALDVQQMRHNRAYAESIVAQALTSTAQPLRDCARRVRLHLRNSDARPMPSPPLPPARSDGRRDGAAQAARLLIDCIGPAGEPLAIRIERASDADALHKLIGDAAARIAAVRGDAAANDYLLRFARAPGRAATDRAADAGLRSDARRAACELVALIGTLGDELAERIELSSDSHTLAALMTEAREGITAVLGADAANEFTQRVALARP